MSQPECSKTLLRECQELLTLTERALEQALGKDFTGLGETLDGREAVIGQIQQIEEFDGAGGFPQETREAVLGIFAAVAKIHEEVCVLVRREMETNIDAATGLWIKAKALLAYDKALSGPHDFDTNK